MKPQVKEQFLPLENYRSEWNKPKQLEIFPEEVQAQIVYIFNASPENIKGEPKEIEPLNNSDM